MSAERSSLPATNTELLQGLSNPANRTVWTQYVERYRPLLERTAQRAGLRVADAEEVAQVALVDFADAYARGEYRRDQGRLRAWLFGILRNRVRDRGRELGRERELRAGETALDGVPAPADLERIWDEEWQAAILRRCAVLVRAEVRPETFEAFERHVMQGEAVAQVAAELSLTPEQVYDAKRRILRRLRELRPVLEETW